MLSIIGLGNPGKKYRDTRHNIGFMAIDHLADAGGIKFSQNGFNSRWGRGTIHGKDVILVKPLAFMNLSGKAVKSLSDFFCIEPKNIVAIYDDVDLEFGTIRIRKKGGSGGHRGMESIIEQLGTNDFPRIRLGIGRPKERVQVDVADYVLSPFSLEEKDKLQEIFDRTNEAVEIILKHGIEKAMNKYNRV